MKSNSPRTLRLLFGFVCLALTACVSTESQADFQATRIAQRTPIAIPLEDIQSVSESDLELSGFAEMYWNSVLTTCDGESFYIGKDQDVFELKNISIETSRFAITEEDTRKGIEMLGYSELKAEVHRQYTGSSSWTERSKIVVETVGSFNLAKKNGDWEIQPDKNSSYSRVECTNVPK